MSNWVLTVNGSAVNLATQKVYVEGYAMGFENPDTCDFFEFAAKLPGAFVDNQTVVLSYLTVPVFSGRIVTRSPEFDDQLGWRIRYHALGLRHFGNLVPVTNPNDGTGFITFNLPGDDPDYNPSLAGMDVGQILSYLFTNHASALSAIGIAGFIAADLSPLTIVPAAPVTIQGTHFFDQVDQLLGDWSAYYICTVEWQTSTSDWRIRVRDTTSFTAHTLTLGVDPIEPTSISRDTSDCYTRVLIRGRSIVEGAYLSTALGTLTPAWTSGEQTAWTWASFANPGGAVDEGNITALSSTVATCQSSNGSETWSTNQWSTAKAWIALINPAATDITQIEYRNVTANASMTAGGTATVTLAYALVNAGYTKYHMVGAMPGSEYDVWRRYNITSSYVATHTLRKFPFPVPYANAFMVQNVSYPVYFIQGATDGFPWAAQLDTVNGQIVFNEPVVKGINTQTDLNTGGASVTAPADVQAFVPYSRGVLTAVAPSNTGGSVNTPTITAGGSSYSSAPAAAFVGDGTGAAGTAVISGGAVTGITMTAGGSGYTFVTVVLTGGGGTGATATATVTTTTPAYSGTAFSVDGIQRTWTLDLPQWLLISDSTNITAYANMLLASVSNAVLTGEVTYHGIYTNAQTIGIALNIAGDNGSSYTTGWESSTITAIPVRGVTFQFPNALGDTVITKMHLSNRRKPFTGEAYYVHPTFSGGGGFGGQGGASAIIGYEHYGAMFAAQGQGGDEGGFEGSEQGFEGMPADERPAPRDEPITPRVHGNLNKRVSGTTGGDQDFTNADNAMLARNDAKMNAPQHPTSMDNTMLARNDAAMADSTNIDNAMLARNDAEMANPIKSPQNPTNTDNVMMANNQTKMANEARAKSNQARAEAAHQEKIARAKKDYNNPNDTFVEGE